MGQTTKTTITRTCDYCGTLITLTQGHITPEQLKQSSGWIVMTKEHVVGVDQLMPIARLLCSESCAINCIQQGHLEPVPVDVDSVGIPNG